MTERKPRGLDWQSWIDRQVEAGQARGDFDDLPGHGKPIAGIERPRDELWWVRDKLRREGVEHLPPSLAIRKRAADAKQRAMDARAEVEARGIIDEINEEIRQLNRLSVEGPPTTLMPFDVEEVLAEWRQRPRPSDDFPRDQSGEPGAGLGSQGSPARAGVGARIRRLLRPRDPTGRRDQRGGPDTFQRRRASNG